MPLPEAHGLQATIDADEATGMFVTADGIHHGGWRHPQASSADQGFDFYRRLAAQAEAAKLDMLFVADKLAVDDLYGNHFATTVRYRASRGTEPYLASNWTLSRYEQAPFVGEAETFRPFWDRLLDAALSDAEVEHVVSGALDNGREGWLLERLVDLLAGPSAGEVAKGLMIARFLDPSPGAEDAWQRIDAMILSNWLAGIRIAARREYGLGQTAEIAARRFVSASDADLALADLVLLQHSADARAFAALKSSIREHAVGLRGAPHEFWPEWHEKLKASSKKNSEGRDKRYLFEDPPKATHWPWRG